MATATEVAMAPWQTDDSTANLQEVAMARAATAAEVEAMEEAVEATQEAMTEVWVVTVTEVAVVDIQI